MDEKRQNNQLKLTFTTLRRGEAPSRSDLEGTESLMAFNETESPAVSERTMEEILEPENLKKALKKVKQKKGAPGIDGMTVEELPKYLREHWTEIRRDILRGKYAPIAVKRVEIPKPGSHKKRKLGIPCVLDRFIQQAMLLVLQKNWEPTFSEHSYGFRPNRSQHQAVEQAQKYVSSGLRWVVDIDLERFFDQVNHDILMSLVAKRVKGKRVLKLLRAFLNAGVMENGLVQSTTEGTPQGGPLSPWLSNVMLHELDKELEKRAHKFVRYADDCNIYVASRRAGERVKAGVTKLLEKRLKLKVNTEKSAVARPWHRKFLGFSFTSNKRPKRRIAPQAVERFKVRIRRMTSRNRGRNLKDIVHELAIYLNGWIGYFGFCESRHILSKLDQWIRRRLKSLIWKRWKHGRKRYAELRKRDVGDRLAAQTAASCHGPWRISNSPALSFAFPNAFFRKLGLPSLASPRIA